MHRYGWWPPPVTDLAPGGRPGCGYSLHVPDTLGARARDLAAQIMREYPGRLRHLAAVAARADALSVTVPTDTVDALAASCWLHDIGYPPALRQTGFPPLEGATYLRQEGSPDDDCALVAHPSAAALSRGSTA